MSHPVIQRELLQDKGLPEPPSSPTRALTVRRNVLSVDPRILSYLDRFNLSDMVQSREDFAVGLGAFSDVFKGLCMVGERGLVMTAMKRLRLQTNATRNVSLHHVMHITIPMKQIQLFEKEIYVWSKLNHPNVLPLLGYAFDADTGYPMLISQWMVQGNALAYVRANDASIDRVMELVSTSIVVSSNQI